MIGQFLHVPKCATPKIVEKGAYGNICLESFTTNLGKL
jgi:hypothetical protein